MPSSRFDPLDGFGNRPSIDHVLKKIHDGQMYVANLEITLAAASAVNVLITAPATGLYHFAYEVDADAAAKGWFCRSPGVTATGATAITSYNMDGSSSNNSPLTIQWGGAYTSSGTVLEPFLLGTAGLFNSSQIGGAAWFERKLAQAGTHLLRILAGAATVQSCIRMYYYKE